MTAPGAPERGYVAGLAEAERRRCHAVNARDWDALLGLLHEDFVYHHWHGRSDGREQWLRHLRDYAGYHTERQSLEADRYGDLAVVTGVLRNTIVRTPSSTAATSVVSAFQIWSLDQGSWRLRAHYSVKNPP